MRIELSAVAKGEMLPATSLEYRSGEVTLALAETEMRPTVLGLVASGRMRPASGEVTIDGRADRGRIRRRVALVDALRVSDPDDEVRVRGVVAEELMFAGLASSPRLVRRWLDGNGFGDLADQAIGTVQPSRRVQLLCELAALRPDVEGLVIVSPDRHGGDPSHWWPVARDLAARGLAVLVIAGSASHRLLTEATEGETDLTAGDASGDPGTGSRDEDPDRAPRTDDASGESETREKDPDRAPGADETDPEESGPDPDPDPQTGDADPDPAPEDDPAEEETEEEE